MAISKKRTYKEGDVVLYYDKDHGRYLDDDYTEEELNDFLDGKYGKYYYALVCYDYDETDLEYNNEIFISFLDGKEDDGALEVKYNKIKYVEPLPMDPNKLAKFARYEITAQELVGDVYPPYLLRAKEKYLMTLEDMYSVLKKAATIPLEQFLKEWVNPFNDYLKYSINYGYDIEDEEEIKKNDDGYRFLPLETDYVNKLIGKVPSEHNLENNSLEILIEEAKKWRDFFALPVEQRDYSDGDKRRYIRDLLWEDELVSASEKELALYIKFVNELCDKNDEDALKMKLHGLAGGDRAFACDWSEALKTYLKLYEKSGDAFWANALGYVYYSGITNEGKPDYDKAFYYYSIAAANGIYEAMYYQADMFKNGYGVAQNTNLAYSILMRLYEDNIKYIYQEKFNNQFAEITLRLGDLYKDGIGVSQDFDKAYFYYLQADYASKMRMLKDCDDEDDKLASDIKNKLNETLPFIRYQTPQKEVTYGWLKDVFVNTCEDNRRFEMKIRKLKNGEFNLKVKLLPKGYKKKQPRFFIVEPEAHFCGMLESITMKTNYAKKVYIGNELLKEGSRTIIFDDSYYDKIQLYGKKVASIECDSFDVIFSQVDDEEMIHFASVKFKNSECLYDYICDIEDVKAGDKVIVKTYRGETVVSVERVYDEVVRDLKLPLSEYKKIIRKADEKMIHLASVKFENSERLYDYICDIDDVNVGDMVVVKTHRSETVVSVERVYDKGSSELELPLSEYKSILRKAED